MERVAWIAVTILWVLVFTGSLWAVGPMVPAKGTYCWTPPTDADLAGYKLYVTEPGGVSTVTDLGKPTTAPAPPVPSQACGSGQVGVIRDQTGKPDGQYSFALTAYDSSGNESARTAAVPFVLQASLDIIPPAVPSSVNVH